MISIEPDDKLLALAVLHWWKDAQYWENGSYNVFSVEPDFVKQAMTIVGPLATMKILQPYLSDDDIVRLCA